MGNGADFGVFHLHLFLFPFCLLVSLWDSGSIFLFSVFSVHTSIIKGNTIPKRI